MTFKKKTEISEDTDSIIIDGKPSKICRKTFISIPSFWVAASLIVVVLGSLGAYGLNNESRTTKLETNQELTDKRLSTIESKYEEQILIQKTNIELLKNNNEILQDIRLKVSRK